MPRRLLNLLTAPSLLLCVAVAVLWVGSYQKGWGFRRGMVPGYQGVCGVRGRSGWVAVRALHPGAPPPEPWRFHGWEWTDPHVVSPPAPRWQVLGLGYTSAPWPGPRWSSGPS